ncbi:4-(cytidine 5'-diphospho)-2-C-methyl-D-erythritol kinase [Fervidobacterium gondwanense]|uniref:4-diphosphocytidyl-2-C-methyl-D-erythritol kinase n=1 Tax=Fervidobacterium gondwanense DSM 13020 TaxID=1121883 RepID=A0A1M7RYK4_FERGO|nr:4-(cytidine 5'-diphospho)-2-C-methyl-D-erythritol kinase [Fervidobacterium gondwanense]SHN51240.1 4-diphosphocytidyl-2-C-methyl-D-erythritol kinase [Fervidobacterium gondwanense DSM 13020]
MGKTCRLLLRTYAKVNLCLDIIRKRSNGYHEISSLFQNISLADKMEIIISNGDGNIQIDSNMHIEDNILYKIWRLLGDKDHDVKVRLEKKIPMGAGLGGGSSNAAGFLKALEYVGVITKDDAYQLAKAVGSDVPFFLYGGTANVAGRGEIIEPLEPLPSFKIDIFYPGYSISTKEAYGNLRSEWFNLAPMGPLELYRAYLENDCEKIKKGTYNIFERVIPNDLLSKIEKLKLEFPAALTGSGSAYFCISSNGKYHFTQKGVEIDAFDEIEG